MKSCVFPDSLQDILQAVVIFRLQLKEILLHYSFPNAIEFVFYYWWNVTQKSMDYYQKIDYSFCENMKMACNFNRQ